MSDIEATGNDRRVWITGATGMVGRNLVEHPKAGGWTLLTPTRRELDLGNGQAVADYVRTTRPDLIIHGAGQVGGIQANIADPVGFLVNNLDLGRNVLMAAYQAEVPAFINLASTCIYPRDRDGALREQDILTGQLEPTNEGYALAKIVAARLCDYINRARPELHYRTLIPCNLYGRYDKFDPAASHLVPAIIAKVDDALREGSSEVEIWGDGSARREFMYAADVADAIWRAAEDPAGVPALMNVGVGEDHTILEYYQTVADILGWTGSFRFDASRPVGMKRKLSDVTRQGNWGWTPPTSLRDGVAATIHFYKQQAAHA